MIASSPGFVARGPRVGTWQVFMAYGRNDTVLPIGHTTRRIVPCLRAAGVLTDVREFDGAHAVPAAIAADAVDSLFRTPPPR